MAAWWAAALLAACSPPTDDATPVANGDEDSGWPSPPRIGAVEPVAGGLRILGQTEPGGRVVLRGANGAAFAASADRQGRFEVQLPFSSDSQVLRPESQRGQESSPASTWLLILDNGRGPSALVAAGAPTRRLDAAPALGAIDSDGAAMILSGEASPGTTIHVSVGGGAEMALSADQQGRWRLTLNENGPAQIMINGTRFEYPGRSRDGEGGRRFDWATADGMLLSVWLPTR